VIVKLDDFMAIDTDEVSVAGMIGKVGIIKRGGLANSDLAE
jgi:hypothetical protein